MDYSCSVAVRLQWTSRWWELRTLMDLRSCGHRWSGADDRETPEGTDAPRTPRRHAQWCVIAGEVGGMTSAMERNSLMELRGVLGINGVAPSSHVLISDQQCARLGACGGFWLCLLMVIRDIEPSLFSFCWKRGEAQVNSQLGIIGNKGVHDSIMSQ